jgi:hypothetical protein
MNSKQSQSVKFYKYDVAFINPGFNKVVEAIERLNNGQKVLLIFENDLIRNDRFQLIQTFPLRFFSVFKSIKNRRLWDKLFLMSPHLVQAQKVIYSHSKSVKAIGKIVDLFFRKTFKTETIILNKQKPENLSFLKTDYLKGVIFQEYKVNVSRLFVELLKHFELNGGKIAVKESITSDEVSTTIQCKTENKRSFIVNTETPLNFACVCKTGNTVFHFVESKNKLQITTINHSKHKPSKTQILHKISKVVDFKSNEIKERKLSYYLSTITLEKILEIVCEPLPGSLKNATVQDNYELSLEKFDIAKQTGITYPDFKILFHRYGTGIDEMIDEAYEQMNITRDPQVIWEGVEDWFQRKNEWKS